MATGALLHPSSEWNLGQKSGGNVVRGRSIGPDTAGQTERRVKYVSRPSRRWASLALAIIMVLSAALHVHWAMGGMWLLPTIMNSPSGELPPDIISGSIAVIVWILAAVMLVVAFLGLTRVHWVGSHLFQRLCVFGLWGFSLLMLAGAAFHILGSRNLGRLVIAPSFLLVGGLAAYLALPQRRGLQATASNGAERRSRLRSVKGVMRIAACVFLCLIAAGALFYCVYLPWNLRWGATDVEVNRIMAGDEICGDANFSPTRAITIDANPKDVWPWIVQIGYKRAGFYSYDSIDNAGIPSAELIIPEFQDVKVGDHIPLDRAGGVIVRVLEPNRLLVMATESGFLTWAWDLREAGPQQTRVVTRVRARLGDAQMKFVWDSFEFFMMRKCLLGIKRRAESSSHQ